jgi:hypothetical protein
MKLNNEHPDGQAADVQAALDSASELNIIIRLKKYS